MENLADDTAGSLSVFLCPNFGDIVFVLGNCDFWLAVDVVDLAKCEMRN